MTASVLPISADFSALLGATGVARVVRIPTSHALKARRAQLERDRDAAREAHHRAASHSERRELSATLHQLANDVRAISREIADVEAKEARVMA